MKTLKLSLLLVLILGVVSDASAACEQFRRLYNTATTVDFCLWEPDGSDLMTSATIVAGDVKVMKDEGAEANCSSGSGACVTDEGSCYSIALTSTEMQAARIMIMIIDSPTKAFLDKCIIIETFGNASAQYQTPDVNVISHSSGAKAEINAEVADVLSVDTFAELSALPGSSPTILQMIQWSYQMARFKLTATATEQKLYKNDGSTLLGTSTLSDDGTTFTRDKSS